MGIAKRCLHQASCPAVSSFLSDLCFDSYEQSQNCTQQLSRCKKDRKEQKNGACICPVGTEGFLCGVCTEDYFREDRQCKRCKDAWIFGSRMIWVYIFSLAVISAIFFRIYLWVTVHYYKQEVTNFFFDEGRFKILFATWQIIGLSSSAIGVDLPEPFNTGLGGFFHLAAFDSLPLPCIFGSWFSYYNNMVLATLLPLFLCVISLAFGSFELTHHHHKRHHVHHPRVCIIHYLKSGRILLFDIRRFWSPEPKILYFFIILLWVSVPAVTLMLVRIIDTLHYSDFYSFLTVDLRLQVTLPLIETRGGIWSLYVSYAALMILIYPLGVPCLWISLLRKHRKGINDWDRREKVSRRLRGIGFLFRCYRGVTIDETPRVLFRIRAIRLSISST